jgi:hypothetical protein
MDILGNREHFFCLWRDIQKSVANRKALSQTLQHNETAQVVACLLSAVAGSAHVGRCGLAVVASPERHRLRAHRTTTPEGKARQAQSIVGFISRVPLSMSLLAAYEVTRKKFRVFFERRRARASVLSSNVSSRRQRHARRLQQVKRD